MGGEEGGWNREVCVEMAMCGEGVVLVAAKVFEERWSNVNTPGA